MARYASSTDVARLAGVSQSSVSRSYRPGASVSKRTREKVLAAAEQLGYRPSIIPRIMLSHRSDLIAVVIGGMYNPLYARMLEEFAIQLHAGGRQMLLVPVDSGHSLDSVLPRLAGYRVDAIVSALAVLSPETAAALAKLRIPVICFNTKVSNAWVTSVSTDNARAGAEIADHFLARGVRSFGFVTGPHDSPASGERLKGFRRRLARRGFNDVRIAQGAFHYEDGFEAALAMFAGKDAPESVFCANDLLAIGAIDAIRTRLRLRVPEDVLVAGFDDIPMAGWAGYELTTFVQDASRMVEETIKIFQHSADGRLDLADARITLPARLVERASTFRLPRRTLT
jgi:DNA-binding LacI/PurR family transcriptional regulator